MRNRWIATLSLGALFLLGNDRCPDPQPVPEPVPQPVDQCKAVCYTYEQHVTDERRAAEAAGYVYMPPTDTRAVIRIQTVPDQDNLPPVDDELYVMIASQATPSLGERDIWHVRYPDRDPHPAVFGPAELYRGENKVAVWYANTGGNDAHFNAQLGGLAFKDPSGYAITYHERGLSPLLQGILKQGGRGVVTSSLVFRSRYEHPKQQTGCDCPGLP